MKGLVIKLFLTALITVTGYTVAVFSAPEISTKIDSLLDLDGLSEKILSLKSGYDNAITDIPSLDEVKSGATDFTEKFTDGLDITKQKIDEVRSGAQKVEETYNQTMNTIDSVKQSLSGAQDIINSVSETASQIQSFSNTLSASGSLSGSTQVSE